MDVMPVNKGSVLLFMASQQTDLNERNPYSEELRKVGLSPHSIQVLGFDFVNSLKLLERLSLDADDIAGIVFTSQRAVEAVRQCFTTSYSSGDQEYSKKFKNVFAHRDIFAVGEATALKIDQLLGLSAIGQNCGNAESLAQYIKTVIVANSKPLLFPCGNLHSHSLPMILNDAGIQVECLTVYETVPHVDLEISVQRFLDNNGYPEFIVYFSPSGVLFTQPILRKLNFPLPEIKFVAIGQSTKEAIEKAELIPFGTAKQPNCKSLTMAILDCR